MACACMSHRAAVAHTALPFLVYKNRYNSNVSRSSCRHATCMVFDILNRRESTLEFLSACSCIASCLQFLPCPSRPSGWNMTARFHFHRCVFKCELGISWWFDLTLTCVAHSKVGLCHCKQAAMLINQLWEWFEHHNSVRNAASFAALSYMMSYCINSQLVSLFPGYHLLYCYAFVARTSSPSQVP